MSSSLVARSAAGRSRTLRGITVAAPGALLAVSLVLLAWHCRGLMLAAAAGEPVAADSATTWLAIGGFLVASVLAVLFVTWRLGSRVSGPEFRLRLALQRIRSRDVAFRISLRRGDLLHGLASECNELLDWLNQNPPDAARTGGDIVDVARGRPGTSA